MKYISLQENDIRTDYNNLSPHLLQFVNKPSGVYLIKNMVHNTHAICNLLMAVMKIKF